MFNGMLLQLRSDLNVTLMMTVASPRFVIKGVALTHAESPSVESMPGVKAAGILAHVLACQDSPETQMLHVIQVSFRYIDPCFFSIKRYTQDMLRVLQKNKSFSL